MASVSKTNKIQFANLVFLFAEFIRADLFSHDSYLKSLISRGDLTANSYQLIMQQINAANSQINLASVSSNFGDQKKFEVSRIDKHFAIIFPFVKFFVFL